MRKGARWVTAARELALAAAEDPPAWVSEEARDAARRAVELLRRDAVAAVVSATRAAAADALGVHFTKLHDWIAPGGWLEAAGSTALDPSRPKGRPRRAKKSTVDS